MEEKLHKILGNNNLKIWFVLFVILMISTRITLVTLLIVISFFTSQEMFYIKEELLSITFTDPESTMIWKTLNSTPIASYIMCLCPIIFFVFHNFHIIAFLLIIGLLAVLRIYDFLLVYSVLNGPEYEKSCPMDTNTHLVNGLDVMYISCLSILCLDYLLFSFYIFPLCFSIYIYDLNGGILYLLELMFITFSSRHSISLFKNIVEINLETPDFIQKSSTSAFTSLGLGFILSCVMRLVFSIFISSKIGIIKYLFFTISVTVSSLSGEYLKSFIFHSTTKNIQIYIPFIGYISILSNIDLVCLGAPITYFFFI